MKTIFAQLVFFFQNKTTQRNFAVLWKFFAFLGCIVIAYSVLFHLLMMYEGRYYSWVTGFYWTMTVMSTLGFGDITFHTDLGLLFTMLVLVSGVLFFLIMLPFIFIQFFYTPWLEAQEKARTPRELPENIQGHVIITNIDPVSTRLIERLIKQQIPYAIVTADTQKATELHDQGYSVVIGEPDKAITYERLRIQRAALVVVTNDDLMSTNIAFTIREVDEVVPIVTDADQANSIDILEFSGNTSVFEFTRMLGESLARRTLGVGMNTNVIGRFDDMVISEMPAMGSELAGKSLIDSGIRRETGVTVIGLMEKGKFKPSTPRTVIAPHTVLLLAGSCQQLAAFDQRFSAPVQRNFQETQVLILGGGRVGMAAAATLAEHGISYRIIEKDPDRANESGSAHLIVGDAADIAVLKEAGIETAKTVIVTTHSDEMNIYLTFYCRQLRGDIQIISRSILESNVAKLHMAGADQVMSYASLGAGKIFQLLKPDEVSLFTEGLVVFNAKAGGILRDKTILESGVREKTGCSIIAIRHDERMIVSPPPETRLAASDELVLIGTPENEQLFLDL
ncbi:MAG: potassium transporter TrkA [Deltaproteobacteria bacterium]|nr:MAG: potassium transporter TrkA [Deltaproteobacteria bacterium]